MLSVKLRLVKTLLSRITYASAAVVLVVALAVAILPPLWLVVQTAFADLVYASSFDGLDILGWSLLYNVVAGVLAVLLGLPLAGLIARGRTFIAGGVAMMCVIAFTFPSIAYTYAWVQAGDLVGAWEWFPLDIVFPIYNLVLAIVTLGCWLAPVAALVIGWQWRRIDMTVQEQALLDGAWMRLTMRWLVRPMLLAWMLCTMMAMQEFVAYESQAGISVSSTEVRNVWRLGARTDGSMVAGDISSPQTRLQAAISVAWPWWAGATLLCILAILATRSSPGVDDGAAVTRSARMPRRLRPGPLTWIGTLLSLSMTLGIPGATMWLLNDAPLNIAEQSPAIVGSLSAGAIVGVSIMLIATGAMIFRVGWMVGVGVVTFLMGGQLQAIAIINLIYEPAVIDALGPDAHTRLYDSLGPVSVAMVGRLLVLAAVAGMLTWRSPLRGLRQLAAVDGASRVQTFRYIVLPTTWPLALAAGAWALALCCGDISATSLLNPLKPPLLAPALQQWVHLLNYDSMIQASLTLTAICASVATVACLLVVLWRWGMTRGALHAAVLLTFAGAALTLNGCGETANTDAPPRIWLKQSAGGDGTVFPRGIVYHRQLDAFFVVDRIAQIIRLDNRGNVVRVWRTPQGAEGKPVGISVGPDGNVYLPDTHYQRVLIYSPDGELLDQFGERGKGLGQFIFPTDVAFDADGRIYVAEYGGNDRVTVFDANHTPLFAFGSLGDGDEQFSRPQSLAVLGDELFVVDSCNHRIAVYTLDGKLKRHLGKLGAEPGQFRFPYGIDVLWEDGEPSLLISEFGGNRLQRIDPKSGKSGATWGRPGRARGEFVYAWGVATDGNRIIGVDAGNHRLQVFRP